MLSPKMTNLNVSTEVLPSFDPLKENSLPLEVLSSTETIGNIRKRTLSDENDDPTKKIKIAFQHPIFQYSSNATKEAIHEARDAQKISQVVTLIKQGNWRPLLTECYQGRSLRMTAFIALAAFEDKEISLDEISTALLFLNAAYSSNRKFKVIPYRNKTKLDASAIPENLRFELVYSVHEITQDCLKKEMNLLKNPPPIEVFKAFEGDSDHPFALPSFPLLQALVDQHKEKINSNFGQELYPVLGSTSERMDMILRLGEPVPKADMAMSLPGDPSITPHALKNVGAILALHDFAHAIARLEGMTPNSLELSKMIESIIGTLPDYTLPLISEDVPFSLPPCESSEEDLHRFVLDSFCGLLVDAVLGSSIDMTTKSLKTQLTRDDLRAVMQKNLMSAVGHHVLTFEASEAVGYEKRDIKTTSVVKLSDQTFITNIVEKALELFISKLP